MPAQNGETHAQSPRQGACLAWQWRFAVIGGVEWSKSGRGRARFFTGHRFSEFSGPNNYQVYIFLQYLGQIRSNKKTFVFRTVFLLAPEKRKIWFIDVGRHRGAYLCWVKWEASLVASEGQRRHGG